MPVKPAAAGADWLAFVPPPAPPPPPPRLLIAPAKIVLTFATSTINGKPTNINKTAATFNILVGIENPPNATVAALDFVSSSSRDLADFLLPGLLLVLFELAEERAVFPVPDLEVELAADFEEL